MGEGSGPFGQAPRRTEGSHPRLYAIPLADGRTRLEFRSATDCTATPPVLLRRRVGTGSCPTFPPSCRRAPYIAPAGPAPRRRNRVHAVGVAGDPARARDRRAQRLMGGLLGLYGHAGPCRRQPAARRPAHHRHRRRGCARAAAGTDGPAVAAPGHPAVRADRSDHALPRADFAARLRLAVRRPNLRDDPARCARASPAFGARLRDDSHAGGRRRDAGLRGGEQPLRADRATTLAGAAPATDAGCPLASPRRAPRGASRQRARAAAAALLRLCHPGARAERDHDHGGDASATLRVSARAASGRSVAACSSASPAAWRGARWRPSACSALRVTRRC